MTAPYKEQPLLHKVCFVRKKSCKRETRILSTDADSNTIKPLEEMK